ncbi:MAG TPA: hypothetical protein PK563_15165, partial [Tenuifilaceae bacterium]|nr:hypothetical protein [Tenuifilaceae bacterium]
YIYESGQGSWNYTSIIVRPSGNSRTITADLAAPIFNINGNGSNITFDGRIGGTGSDSQLTISNTSGSVFYIYSVTGVDNIAIQYCNLIGNGDEIITLFTENSTITNILIDNCSIGSESLTVTNGIRSYSTGSGSITATVSNCNIFNFWNATSSSKGIFLDQGNEGWTISHNNFYQTVARTATAANTHYLIYVDGGDGHTISDNYFGGSEPQCGGTAWTINGDFANKFVGVYLNVGSTTPANVNGNVIRNFNHTYHSTTSATDSHGIWAGIYLAGGDANIGTGTSNKIGTSTGTDNIVVNSTAAADVASFGIGINSAGSTVNVNNNQIGGITLNASSITNAHSFTAINIVSGSNFIVENNLIGSTDTNNSIFLSNESNWESENQIAKGITSTSDGNVTIRSNIISRITNNGTSKGGTFGIDCSAGSYIVQNNTIDNLFSNANNSTIMGVVIGINIYNTIGNQKITGNTITNLKTTTLWAEKWIYGIYFTNNTAEENIVSHNYINNIEFTENEGRGIGIKIENSTTTIAMNNAIRLGHNQTNNRFIVGILSGGNNKILGNSVYITGSFDAEDLDSRSFAYYKYPGSDVVKNNIFYNNMSTTGFIYEDHVCIGIWDYPNASVISDYNNLLSSGREEVVAKTTELFSMTHITTQLSLEQWQTQENQDENSLSVDPQFVGADGVTPDLHISVSSPMINMGNSVYPLVVDIDDDIRDQQPDIGCDEFYTGSILVGTGETYTTLKQAFDAINDGTITGNISINIQSSTTETATATLYQSGYNGTSSYSSVSLGTVSEDIAVSGNLAAPIVSFNGAHNVNMVDLAIENESSDGYCIQFTNSASNNRIAGCNLIGNTQLSDKGIITFDVAGSGTGNNNNIIESCTFENGASNYQYGVVSAGTESVGNNDNEIAESKIYNFWSNGNSSAGIYLDENNANWNISDNHLYQTETITATGGRNHYGIFSLSSNNISISSNNIGGTDEECGGTAWTVNGSEANTYTGIFISGENTGESTVSGNTIGNFSWTAAPEANMYEGPGVWTAIAYGGGIISITNNTIGASTGVKNIDIETAAGYHVASYGIKGGIDGANVTISGNVIGSIEVSCSSVDFSHIFVGIQNDGATEIYITNNFIGSEETSTSISATTACTHTAIGQHVAGIVNNANTTVSQISSNVIKNLHNSSVSDWSSDSGSPFGHTILGIAVTDGINSISLNTIKRLSTSSIDARTESVRGISIVSDKAGQEINQNSISELSTTNDAGNSSLVGIWYDGPLGGTNTIGSNRIFYITSAYYESLASQIYGIYIANGSASIIKNNMISLGYSETAGHYITGIYTSKNGTFYHNSVVINGDVTGLLDENTFAFRINLATSTAVVKNNLFVNTRTNNGSGKNYAALCQGTIELDYNAYWVDGAGTALGNDGTDDKTELPIVSGQDQNSINQEVIFTHPTGIIVADLHTSSAVVNGVADPSVGITTDFDGETRNLSYPDIGADEFTLPVVFDPGANLDFGWTDVLTPT